MLTLLVTKDVTSQWDLGLELLEPEYEEQLSKSEINFDDALKCGLAMFQLWLKNSPKPQYSQLVEALRGINLNSLASKIEANSLAEGLIEVTKAGTYKLYIVALLCNRAIANSW